MKFNNSNQLVDYWETKVKEFEEELNKELYHLTEDEKKELCVIEAKKYLSDIRKYANNLHALFYIEEKFQNSNEVDRKFHREYYAEFYPHMAEIDIMIRG